MPTHQDSRPPLWRSCCLHQEVAKRKEMGNPRRSQWLLPGRGSRAGWENAFSSILGTLSSTEVYNSFNLNSHRQKANTAAQDSIPLSNFIWMLGLPFELQYIWSRKKVKTVLFFKLFSIKSLFFFVTGIDVLEVQIIEKTTLRHKSSIFKYLTQSLSKNIFPRHLTTHLVGHPSDVN